MYAIYLYTIQTLSYIIHALRFLHASCNTASKRSDCLPWWLSFL